MSGAGSVNAASNPLLAQLRKRREKTVDLGEGLSVTFLRPREGEMGPLFQGDGEARVMRVQLEQVCRCVVGWSGFTEATLLGAGVGSSDPLPFDAAVWAEIVTDRVEWFGLVSQAILDSMVEHIERKGTAEKN